MKAQKRILLMVVVLLLASLACSLGGGPQGAVKGFLKAIDNGDSAKAVGYMSSGTIDTLGYSKWISMVEETMIPEVVGQGGIRKIDIRDSSTGGDFARVDFTITYGNGGTEDGYFDLVKEDGDWKIDLDPFSK